MNNKGKYFRRALAITLVLIMSAGVVFVGAPEYAHAATSKKLVSKVVCYTKVGNSWEETGVIEFTYNKKGDPVKIYRNNNGSKKVYTYVYTYNKNGKKVKAKEYIKTREDGKYLAYTLKYDNAGRLKSYNDEVELMGSDYKYGKNGYITMIEGEDYDYKSMHYRWNGNVPQILKVNEYGHIYTQTSFNEKGLVEKTHARYLPEGDRTFTYSFINGRVKTIKITEKRKDGSQNHYKYVLKYSNKNTDSSGYRAMINYIAARYTTYTGTNWF